MTSETFTLHLTFSAAGIADAREQAVIYSEAVGILRPEVTVLDTRLSGARAWADSEALFCGKAGPDGEQCACVRDHGGFHRAAGLGALSWGDGD